jgi:hypothetical protein
VAILLQMRDDRKSGYTVTATICAGWLADTPGGYLYDCGLKPIGAPAGDMIIITIVNSGRSGAHAASASLFCVINGACERRIGRIVGPDRDLFPSQVDAGGNIMFPVAFPCPQEITNLKPGPIGFESTVQLATGEEIKTNRLTLDLPVQPRCKTAPPRHGGVMPSVTPSTTS